MKSFKKYLSEHIVEQKTYTVVNKHNPKEMHVIKADTDYEMLEKMLKRAVTKDDVNFFKQNYTYAISEGKYNQKQPWALIDTSANNKIIATSSDESGVKQSISSAHLPPLRVKDKSTLKIVKMKKPQQAGELLQSNNLVESNQKYKVFVNGELKSTHSSEEDAKQAVKNLKWNLKNATKEPFAKASSGKVSDYEFRIVKENDSRESERLSYIKSLELPPGDNKLTDDQLKDFAKRSHTFVKFPNSPAHLSANNDINNMGPTRLQQVIAHPKVNAFYKHKARQRLKELNENLTERCWDGYKPTPGKKPYEKGSCMKEDDDIQEEAEHDGKKVTLNKPVRTPDGPKKFAVYVKNDKGNVVKVTFGDPDMEIKRDSDDRRANFRARHNCDDPGPKWKARYWSCKMWSDTPVSKITESEYIDTIQKIKTAVIAEGYDFKELSGPRKKDVVGRIVGLQGNSPEEALKKRLSLSGYRNVSVTVKDGVYSVKGQYGSDPKDSDISHYQLDEAVEVDASSAAKLFQKFLRSTGAPDKVTTFQDSPSTQSKKVFVGRSVNSKFDYTVDVSSGIVTATERGKIKNRSFRWNEKTGKLEINEASPPDVEIEKWIKDNKKEFSKQYGEEKGKQILYATAWRMYNNK